MRRSRPFRRAAAALALLPLALAAVPAAAAPPAPAAPAPPAAPVPPPDAAIVALGDGFATLDFRFDPEEGMFTLHVLDGEGNERVRLRQEMVFLKVLSETEGERDQVVLLMAQESSGTGDEKGNAATFAGGNRRLIGRESFDVVLEGVTILGETFRRVPFRWPSAPDTTAAR